MKKPKHKKIDGAYHDVREIKGYNEAIDDCEAYYSNALNVILAKASSDNLDKETILGRINEI